MHNSRKSHNAHHETQKRFKNIYGKIRWSKSPKKQHHGDKEFFIEKHRSHKVFKKIASKKFRRKSKEVDTSKINQKELNKAYDYWGLD